MDLLHRLDRHAVAEIFLDGLMAVGTAVDTRFQYVTEDNDEPVVKFYHFY